MVLGQVFVKLLELGLVLVNKWAKDQKTRDEWERLVNEARRTYNQKGATEASDLKRDYDEIKKDLKDGNFRL